MTTAVASPEAAKRPAAEGQIRLLNRGFMSTLGIGLFGAVAGAFGGSLATGIGFGVPLVALGGFIAWGLRQGFQSREDTRQKFADSCYFLGFLFTMFALMAGFLPAGLSGARLSSQSILRFFGLALGSTALGLIGRILVIQNGSSTDEGQLHIEAEVAEMARKVAEHAKAIAADLSAARVQIADQQARALEAMTVTASKGLEDVAAKAALSLTRTSRSLAAYQADIDRRHAALAETFDQLDRGASDQFEKMNSIVATVRDTQGLISTATTNLAAEVDRLTAELRPLREQSVAAVAESTAHIRQLSQAFGAVAAGQGLVTDSLGAVVVEARKAVMAMSAAQVSGEQAAAAAGALARRNEAAGLELAEIMTSVRRRADEAVGQDAVAFRRDLNEAGARFGEIVRSFTADLKALDEKVAQP